MIRNTSLVGLLIREALCRGLAGLSNQSVGHWLLRVSHRGETEGSVRCPPTFLIPSAIPFRIPDGMRLHGREVINIRVLLGRELILFKIYSCLRISIGLVAGFPFIVPVSRLLMSVRGNVLLLLFWSLNVHVLIFV